MSIPISNSYVVPKKNRYNRLSIDYNTFCLLILSSFMHLNGLFFMLFVDIGIAKNYKICFKIFETIQFYIYIFSSLLKLFHDALCFTMQKRFFLNHQIISIYFILVIWRKIYFSPNAETI